MKPNEIATLLTDDIDYNNGLLLESDINTQYKTAYAKLNEIEGPITIDDEDYDTIKTIYESQKSMINTVFQQVPKIHKAITTLNDLAISKWISKTQVTQNSRQYAQKVFEETTTIDNIIWGYDEWKIMGNEMLEKLSGTDIRRFKMWTEGINQFKNVLQAIQALH